jgi:hypothetical protein
MEPDAALAHACRALWLATLSLMTAYMQHAAPAHRLLLARRIARNLRTLEAQDCFAADCRARFGRIARRWERKAAPGEAPALAVLAANLRSALTGLR